MVTLHRKAGRLWPALLVLLVVGPAQARQGTGPGAGDDGAVVGFGRALALVGNEAFVGEPLNELGPGAVYVFAREPGTGAWTEQQRLTASDGIFADGFGRAVAVAGDVLLVGADAQDGTRGAAYVFRKAPATGQWVEDARLTAADAAPGHRLGNAVALQGDAALVGASASDGDTGAAYVFRYEDGAWQQEAQLTASDGVPGDQFGVALALAGGEALVGAHGHDAQTGAVYVFRRNAGGAWTETTMLTASDGEQEEYFGETLARQGDELLVGARQHQMVGAVYVFRKEEVGEWGEQDKLVDSAGQAGERFGQSVAVAGNALWIGAPFADGFTGAVFAYRRESAEDVWIEQEKIGGSQVGDGVVTFGEVVAVEGSYALEGSIREDFGVGAAYVFEQDGASGAWVEQARLAGSIAGPAAILGAPVACADGTAALFPCGNVDLMAYLPTHEIGGARGAGANDLWGWTDPETGKEYALVGRVDGTGFVDVTDPVNPVYLGNLPTHTVASVWRDIKVYDDHAFVVADGAGAHGMQVFDLTQLRSVTTPPVTFAETAHYDGIASAHNLAINEETGFAYVVGASSGGNTCGGGLHMVDVRDPLQPSFAGCFADLTTGRSGTGYTHDAQCVIYHGHDVEHQGREICFGSNETALSIADVTDKRNPVALAAASYPNVAYTHQGWLTDDQRYFFLDDELDELTLQTRTRTLIWDLADLDDPQLLAEYNGSTGAIDHNQYVVGTYVFQSNYASGLRILDITDVAHPVEVAFFDVFPANDNAGFSGSWSNYPFFDSGVVLVTGREAGLFIVKPTTITVAAEPQETPGTIALAPAYPNPFNPATTLTLTLPQAQRLDVTVYDVLGRAVAVVHRGSLSAGVHRFVFEADGLPGGTYFVRAQGSSTTRTQAVTLVK